MPIPPFWGDDSMKRWSPFMDLLCLQYLMHNDCVFAVFAAFKCVPLLCAFVGLIVCGEARESRLSQ